jgi:hypothetical protein
MNLPTLKKMLITGTAIILGTLVFGAACVFAFAAGIYIAIQIVA